VKFVSVAVTLWRPHTYLPQGCVSVSSPKSFNSYFKTDSNYEAKKQLMVLKTIMPGAVEKHYAIGESLYPTIPPTYSPSQSHKTIDLKRQQ
jgi:hypothetical protein